MRCARRWARDRRHVPHNEAIRGRAPPQGSRTGAERVPPPPIEIDHDRRDRDRAARGIDLSSHDPSRAGALPSGSAPAARGPRPFNPEPEGPGFYAVTRYWDIREVHRNSPCTPRSRRDLLEDLDPDQIGPASHDDTDPPRHTELRKLIRAASPPRAVKVWEDACTRSATGSSRVAAKRRVRLRLRSLRNPMQVFAEILGVPQGTAATSWTWRPFLATRTPEYATRRG